MPWAKALPPARLMTTAIAAAEIAAFELIVASAELVRFCNFMARLLIVSRAER
jgi:hypothetical protein